MIQKLTEYVETSNGKIFESERKCGDDAFYLWNAIWKQNTD